ncbi:MAG: cache domain-containing protein [Negativicutes bacterium]|nr:cache domain-containing protein [Negativicutes bacterium]
MRTQPLQRQFGLWTVLLLVVPSLLIMGIYTVGQLDTSRQQSLEMISQQVDSQKRLVEYWLAERIGDVRDLSHADAFRTLNERQMRLALDVRQQDLRDFDSLSYIDKDGFFRMSTLSGGIQFPSAVGRPYFEAARAGREYISEVVVGRNSGAPIVNFSTPVYDYAGNFQGVILGSVKTTTLETLMQGSRVGRTGEVLLVNSEGLMLTEPRFIEVLRARGVVDGSAILKLKMADDALRSIRFGESGTASWTDYLGDRVLGAYQGIPERGWTLIGKINEAEILAPVYTRLKQMAAGTLVLLLLLLPLASRLTNRVKQPIDWLIGQSGRVATEDYAAVSKAECPARLPRELDTLCQTFIAMSRKIEQTVGLLKENEVALQGKVVEIQEINCALEEEIGERQAAQEALQRMNVHLQELNTTLEEEISVRQAAEDALQRLNVELEDKVRDRTRQLEEINCALEEEISERQAAQEKLRGTNEALTVSEARYRGLFEHMHSAFNIRKVITDDSGRPVDLVYIEVNPGFEKLYGLSAAEVEGRRVTEVFPGIEKEFFDWIQMLGNVALTGEPSVSEQYFASAGKWLRLDIYSPAQDYVATVMQDITESKQSQERLKHYAADLEEANKELKSFASIVAHDFRTPMVNLKGFSQELRYSLDELKEIIEAESASLLPAARERLDALFKGDLPDALRFIDSSVDRLDRMVNVLLNLAREGRREMIYRKVDVGELVAGLLRSFDHQLARNGIEVQIEPLPFIDTDQAAMEQIIGNLLDNAIKYLEPGRPGKIAVSCRVSGDEYLFSIQDNGRGIATEDLEKVFEIFRRAGRQDVPGDGLGLAFVRTLVRRMGGRIWCQSQLGVGTVMHFTVPKL